MSSGHTRRKVDRRLSSDGLIRVESLLTLSWHFSAVYPSSQTTVPFSEHQPSQRITEAVAAEPEGTLVNKSTGTEVTYLY